MASLPVKTIGGIPAPSSPDRIRSDAFTFNYIALILIILCFSASFTVGPTMEVEKLWASNAPLDVAAPEMKDESSLGVVVFEKMFSQENSTPDRSKVGALAELLRAHDLNLSILVTPTSPEAPEAENLGRSVALFRALLAEGIAEELLDIRAQNTVSSVEVEVVIAKEEWL